MAQLFTPLALRGATFKNRIIVSPMCQYAAVDGAATEWHFEHHARFALGGVGGAVVEIDSRDAGRQDHARLPRPLG